ncbi:MAG: response regulator [Gorillibacterium sp.]|nr:response regulator [Gorillibacterium sp.]
MYQLLIVDDETHLVDSMAETIDWQQVGIGAVYRAYSGQEALEMIRTHSIDIVITDIRMPGISGLDLIKQIYLAWNRIKCIIVSGYAEFEYAKLALEYSVENYLLKPVSDEEVVEAVETVIQHLQTEWINVSSRQRSEKALKDHLPSLQSQLLKELLHGKRIKAELLKDKLELYELNFTTDDSACVMMLRLEEPFQNYNNQDLALIEYSVCNIAQETFEDAFELWCGKETHDYLVIIVKRRSVPLKSTSATFEQYTAHFQHCVKTYLKGSISLISSAWGTFPAQIPDLYQSVLLAFRQMVGSEDQELLLSLEVPFTKPNAVHALHYLYDPPSLIQLLEVGRWNEAEEKLELTWKEFTKDGSESQELLIEAYSAILHALTYLTHKNGKRLSDLFGAEYETWINRKIQSVSQLKEWSFRALEIIKQDLAENTKGMKAHVIQRVKEFVESQFNIDVSLQAMADHVYHHPVYLSKLFKSETKESLSDYIYRVRMEKAAYWLRNSDMKIYEITSELGYQNPQYFSKVFRKYFGSTPQDYRDA